MTFRLQSCVLILLHICVQMRHSSVKMYYAECCYAFPYTVRFVWYKEDDMYIFILSTHNMTEFVVVNGQLHHLATIQILMNMLTNSAGSTSVTNHKGLLIRATLQLLQWSYSSQ